jgi:hypothetical protein
MEATIDLKWSLWTECKGTWKEYAPELLKTLHALKVGESVTIHTAPRKEIRYGTVKITREKKTVWSADGWFASEWDDPTCLADTLGLLSDDPDSKEDDTKIDEFRQTLPFTHHLYEPGMEREFYHKARSLQALLSKVDSEEGLLIKDDQEAWEDIELSYKDKV